MFSKVNLVSTCVTAIWGFFGGYLLWGIIADPILQDHLGTANATMKEIPDMIHLAIGCALVALFFSHIFSKWSRGAHSISQGVEFGIMIGLLLGFGNGIIDFSTIGILDITGTLINGLVYVVHFAIMGVLASLVFNKMSN